MKKILLYGSFVLLAASISACASTNPGYGGYNRPQAQISVNTFYNELDPYGRWMDYGNYGRVWIPNVGGDFRPYYTNGNWVYSDYGWTWNSNYNWGWAPFHYGRWMMDNSYGWMWIPGTEWAPAWVNWRSGGDYYGWAPMGPGGNIGVNINIPMNQWAFIPSRYMGDPYMSRYYVPYGNYNSFFGHTTIINNTYVINNRRYYRGPDVREVENITRRRIEPVRVVNNGRPGASLTRNEYRTYRPELNNGTVRPGAGNTRGDGTGQPVDNNRIGPRRNWDRGNVDNSRPMPTAPEGSRPRRILEQPSNGTVSPAPMPNNNNGEFRPRRVYEDRPSAPDRPTSSPAPTPSAPAPRRVFEQQPSQPRPQPQSQPRMETRPAPAPSSPSPSPAPPSRRAGATRG